MDREVRLPNARQTNEERGRLAGREAVVTGASSGIGRAIATAFAREGASVLLGYRSNRAGAEETAEAIRKAGGQASVGQVDVAQEEAVRRFVAEAFAARGRIDVWVNNAGADILTGDGRALSDTEKLDLALQVDLRGTALCSWAVAERMRTQGEGVILNLSWDHVATGAPGRLAEIYAAAKGGVLAFSKCLARSFAPEVRVHVLSPGWIATAYADGLPAETRERLVAATPLRRWGTPEEVAHAAVFLASAEASFLTGTTLPIGGGAVM
jgi:3-oxoacyl-[acyl-carrier protein] reductase